MSKEKEKKDEELKTDKAEDKKADQAKEEKADKSKDTEEKKSSDKADTKEAAKDKTSEDKEKSKDKKSDKDDKKKEDPRDAKIKSLQDQLLRQMAEFDNFRKRTEKEKSNMYSAGAGDVIKKFIEVLDNFERGLKDVPEDTDDAFQKGMLAIYKQFKSTIDGLGVKEIDALGKTFDPNYHNAVMHEDNPDKGEQEIVQVLQKGYTYNDKVLRYAMVKVAN
ncbi:MAG: nucleotide exchange factor GrpE [Lachnospiraceae bacterium]|uniref:Protein GrpE n=1 Tax=Candidatus Weimeria bifida TaxID=2599074 RepID=A0A6N7J0M4_9FIRM|nr:nucleotide exchange factor GrpE [Candidatus Weimeria bifida]RRF97028.1 MAG: nucleotide exchange factor GrpE [Lachnospiraceae bacterium]